MYITKSDSMRTVLAAILLVLLFLFLFGATFTFRVDADGVSTEYAITWITTHKDKANE